MIKFLFGGGWWTAWYLVFWAGAFMFVFLPVLMIIRDAVPKPAGPASLASVVFTMGVGMFFGVVTVIDATVAARLCGQSWVVSLVIGLIAAAAASVASYYVVMRVCTKGGYGWSWAAGLVCAALLAANLVILSIARHEPKRDAATPLIEARPQAVAPTP